MPAGRPADSHRLVAEVLHDGQRWSAVQKGHALKQPADVTRSAGVFAWREHPPGRAHLARGGTFIEPGKAARLAHRGVQPAQLVDQLQLPGLATRPDAPCRDGMKLVTRQAASAPDYLEAQLV